MKNRIPMPVLITVGALVVGYAAICLLIYFQQGSLLFPRASVDMDLQRQWQPQRIEIPFDAGTIEGWRATNAGANNNVVILYFGGNAEDVLYSTTTAQRFHTQTFLATRYRGYGATPGEPSEANLFADALVVYDYAIRTLNARPENIVVMGRSLGSGVATYLAANRPVKALVLITPYDSMTAVAQAQYPYLPVRWLLKHPFASDQLADRIMIPVLLLAATDDTLIPPLHAQRLQAKLGAKGELHVLENVGHNDIETHAQYYELINRFLAKTTAGS